MSQSTLFDNENKYLSYEEIISEYATEFKKYNSPNADTYFGFWMQTLADLELLKTTGSKIQFLVEGAFSNFLPNINQKGIKFENKILEIDISQYIQDIEVRNMIIDNSKIIIEL